MLGAQPSFLGPAQHRCCTFRVWQSWTHSSLPARCAQPQLAPGGAAKAASPGRTGLMVCIECNESRLGCGCVLPNLSLRLQLWGACSSGMAGVLWWEDSRKLVSAPGSVPREPARPWAQPRQGRGVNARCTPNVGIASNTAACRIGTGAVPAPASSACLQSPQACGLEVTYKGCQCSLVCPPWWLSCAPLLCAAHGCMCP